MDHLRVVEEDDKNALVLQVCGNFIRRIGQSGVIKNLRWLLLSYNLAFRRTSPSTSGRHFLLNFRCQRSSLSMKLIFVSDSYLKSCTFLAVLPILLPSLLLVLNGQTRTMIALEVVEQGKLMTFRKLQVYFEFRLSSTSAMFFICCVVALHESQSQALNSNLLRDKLKLQW